MTTPITPELEIVGTPPDLNGRICEGFICEGYEFDGEAAATANVTYWKFGDAWYRLYFEPHMVFWREWNEQPKPWKIDEESWNYPHADVGAGAGVVGVRLGSYEMSATPEGSKVLFRFENGTQIVIEDKNEVASYAVI
jgi:hypothetical protein